MNKLKVLLILALLVGTAGLLPGVAAEQRAVLAADGPVVDPEVWTALVENPERMVAFRAETTPTQAERLGVALEALQSAGSVDEFQILYGQDAITGRGSGHAVRFLAAWPSVTRISVADEDDEPTPDGEMLAQATDAALATAAFAGTVTRADTGIPLEGIRVRAYLQTGPTRWLLVATVLTGSDGSYIASGLEPGIYRARFEDPGGDHVPQYYNNEDSFGSATPFLLEDGQTTTDIDAALEQAGHIAGTVTAVADGEPVEDIVVSAHHSTNGGWESVASAVSGGDGTYDIGGLPAGTYRVRFADVYSPPRYMAQVYDGQVDLADGDDVFVTAGATTSGIDAAMGDYGRIEGTVSGPGDIAIEGVNVDVLQYNSDQGEWDWASGDTTDADGAYVAYGLVTRHYRVHFSDAKGQYGEQYYDNKASIETADDVSVTLGDATEGIDASLDLAPQTVSHGLAEGWNLISLPVELDDPAIEGALETITGTYNVVWAYDGCAPPEDQWLKYDPDDALSSLTEVDTVHGYWIDLDAPGDLEITGLHPISTEIGLCRGWNLIGYASTTEKPVEEVFAPIAGQYDLVYGYVGGDDPRWEVHIPGFPGSTLEEMRPWSGYWIRVTVPSATLTIPGR